MPTIEFTLPSGAAGMAAGMTRASIIKQLDQIKKQHNISYSYETVKYRFRVTLTSKDLTLLSLVWKLSNSWHRYRILEDS